MSEAREGWVGVDLDGTLARYDGWKGELHIGDPVPEMVARVKRVLELGLAVRIFTARVSEPEGRERIAEAVGDWCERHLGQRLRVTHEKDYQLIELWDDRAVQVQPNSGEFVAGSFSRVLDIE